MPQWLFGSHYTIEEKEKNQLINTKINYKSHKFENSGSARVLFIYKKINHGGKNHGKNQSQG